jgi:ADP-heptose:LPS heptosyltransferase
MGWGDDLIFLGKAEEIHKKTGKKIIPIYGSGWSPMFDNVEFITSEKTVDSLYVNARDTNALSDVHVDYYGIRKEKTILGQKIIFRNFKPTPFRLRLTQKEQDEADNIISTYGIGNFCIVNPDYKSTFFSSNKNWGFKKYQELANRLSKHIECVRLKPTDKKYREPELKNSVNIETQNVRVAAAIMEKSQFGITYDGLLQHIFAGFKIPCVVIQGGLVDTNVMSYDTNIHHTYKHHMTPCGSMYDCAHCKEANDSITVDEIFESCMKVMNENSNHTS